MMELTECKNRNDDEPHSMNSGWATLRRPNMNTEESDSHRNDKLEHLPRSDCDKLIGISHEVER